MVAIAAIAVAPPVQAQPFPDEPPPTPSLPAATDLILVDRPVSGPNALNLTLVTPPEDRPTIPVDPFSNERLSDAPAPEQSDGNRAPVAIPDVFTTPEGVPLTVTAPGHLANDFDPDGDAVEWLSYTLPSEGTMSGMMADGAFVYTPDPGFSGLDEISYAIGDGNGGIAFGKLLIFVSDLLPPDDTTPPVCGEIDFAFDGTNYEIVSSDDVGIASVTFTRLTINLDGYVDDGGPQGSFAQGDVYTTGNPDPTSVGLRARFTVLSGSFSFLVTVADAAGNEAVCDPVVTDLPAALPAVTALNATYPNPAGASSSVTVPFSLAESTDIHVVVYDVLGREVAVLANEVMEAGSYGVAWPEAASLPAGTYLVRMTAGEVVQTKRLTLVR